MVYIIEIYTPGFEIDITTATYVYNNNKIKAFTIAVQYKKCYADEISVNVYEAYNEYTNKRKLLKHYE